MSTTTTVTATRNSIIDSQPRVAKTVRIHRFSPNVTFIPPRPAARRDTEKVKPVAKPAAQSTTPSTARAHRRMRSNTTPPLPTTSLTAAVAPPRKSEDVQRPNLQREAACKWRFHSVVSPCLCEREAAPAVAPIEVLNLRQLPGANTPWLGSPSWTNFGNAPWGSPQSECQPTFPSQSQPIQSQPIQSQPIQSQPIQSQSIQSQPIVSPPPSYPTVTRSKSAPDHPQPWSPARASTRALLSVNTSAASSQRSSWASFESSCPPLTRSQTQQRPSTSPSTHTISPISPLSFEHADWPDFQEYHVEVVDDEEDNVSPTSTMNNMAWSGLCLTGATMTPKATLYERPTRPTSRTPVQQDRRDGFEGPFLSIVDLPPRAASADMFRSQADRDAATLPQRATTVSHSPSGSRPSRPNSIKRKPVAALNLKLALPDKITARHVTMSPSETTPGWRHTIAYPSEDRIPDAYPSRARVQSQMALDDSGLPTPRLYNSHHHHNNHHHHSNNNSSNHHHNSSIHSNAIPRVTVEEVSHPRLGFGRRPSKQALRLAAEEQLRRRTIEPSGIGLDSEQWLDLQLAVMGIPASWNSGADAPMSASIF